MCIFNVCRIERGDGGEGGEALHGELAAGSRRAPRRGFEPAERAPRDGSSRRLDPASPLAPPSPRRPTILSLYLFGISLHDVRVPPGSFFALFPVQAHRSGADGSRGGGGVAIRGRTNPTVFPGVDGSLYAYGGGESSADGSGSGEGRPVLDVMAVSTRPSKMRRVPKYRNFRSVS